MKNPEIHQDLEEIKDIMLRNKQMQSRETMIQKLKDDSERFGKLLGYDFDNDPLGLVNYLINSPDSVNTQVARSEFLVTPENIKELESTITTARETIFKLGKPMITHQDYEELYEDQPSTINHALNEYWMRTDIGDAVADKSPFEDLDKKGKRLDMCVNDTMGSINYTFWFDNSYDIYIQFTNPETGEYEASYGSNGPIQKMDDREFRLINHYTQTFLREVESSSDDSSN